MAMLDQILIADVTIGAYFAAFYIVRAALLKLLSRRSAEINLLRAIAFAPFVPFLWPLVVWILAAGLFRDDRNNPAPLEHESKSW